MKAERPSVRERFAQQTGLYVEESAKLGRRAAQPTRSTSRIYFVTTLYHFLNNYLSCDCSGEVSKLRYRLGRLSDFLELVNTKRAVIISFNWDLVLDAGLFPEGSVPDYGFSDSQHGPTLLKPHGSLNWFRGVHGERIKSDRKEVLHDAPGDLVYRFNHYRSPQGKFTYMPLIIPPVFNKNFDRPIFRDTWRKCVSEISRAKSVTFLGYSLPDADMHARFIFRCGFENQIQGELLADGGRAPATGESLVGIVNPDLGAAKRTESAIGSRKRSVEWKPMLVADWKS